MGICQGVGCSLGSLNKLKSIAEECKNVTVAGYKLSSQGVFEKRLLVQHRQVLSLFIVTIWGHFEQTLGCSKMYKILSKLSCVSADVILTAFKMLLVVNLCPVDMVVITAVMTVKCFWHAAKLLLPKFLGYFHNSSLYIKPGYNLSACLFQTCFVQRPTWNIWIANF